MRAYQAHPMLTKDYVLGVVARYADRATAKMWVDDYGNCMSGAVICVSYDLSNIVGADDVSYNPYRTFETYLGIPSFIAELIDKCCRDPFQPPALAHAAMELLEAIPIGADLSVVADRIKVRMLREVAHPVAWMSYSLIERAADGIESGWMRDDREAVERMCQNRSSPANIFNALSRDEAWACRVALWTLGGDPAFVDSRQALSVSSLLFEELGGVLGVGR